MKTVEEFYKEFMGSNELQEELESASNEVLEVFLKKHGLPKHTFHSLRHTFATRVIEKGYDPKAVSEILGHKNVKTTLELYVHPSMMHKREIIEAASLFPEN